MRKIWDFKTSAETLSAGNYEFVFNAVISGDTPESLEGLADSWLIYRMKATIERGILQQNSVARKQVRLIRTLDPASDELGQPAVSPSRIDFVMLLLATFLLAKYIPYTYNC